MVKRYLMTPGPTPVPPEVLGAMSAPIVHHRSPEFKEVYARLLDRLRLVARTENDVLLFTASGSGAMESAVTNVCSPGERVLVVAAGRFGERWIGLAERFGADVVALQYAWGETPRPDDVAAKLAEIGGAHAVFLTHSDTSTGVVADVGEMAARVAGSGALVVVDAVSSLGALPVQADEWGLDVVVSGSQKALMTPPGLAFATASPRALEAAARAKTPRFYFDWIRTREAQEGSLAPFTPAISLVLGLDVAVSLLLEEGLDAVFDRHVRLGRACRAGVKAMGLELFSPDEDRSAVVTAIRMPPDIDGTAVVLSLRERQGVTIAGGQGQLKGRIVRIGHVGYMDLFDVTTALAALETALAEAGAAVERGAAVPAALDAYGDGVVARA
ncbi:MAG: alanine--glyoxylate aminotransferase family protein [Actinobacteria bacterium]|nr:alanine--glyoxylate aminotransferase family protein [Actinomycetota bacterium]